jgi:hypothetical protein
MMALTVIGGLVSAVGTVMQAQAASAAAEQNAKIADYNAQVAERNRATALAQADSESRDLARQHRRQLAQIRVAYGTSGLTMEGTPLDVIEDTALEQELDQEKTRYKGQLRAIGYQDEENNYKMKAELHRMEAKSAKTAGFIGAVGGFFNSVAKGAGSSLLQVG